MALLGRHVRQLRSLAHHLDPIVTVGKNDITDSLVAQLDEALESHELVKCSALDTSSLSAREAAEELAERTGADVVQVIGRKFTLYRETSRRDVEKIKLV